jgi:hypothetical protein
MICFLRILGKWGLLLGVIPKCLPSFWEATALNLRTLRRFQVSYSDGVIVPRREIDSTTYSDP